MFTIKHYENMCLKMLSFIAFVENFICFHINTMIFSTKSEKYTENKVKESCKNIGMIVESNKYEV